MISSVGVREEAEVRFTCAFLLRLRLCFGAGITWHRSGCLFHGVSDSSRLTLHWLRR